MQSGRDLPFQDDDGWYPSQTSERRTILGLAWLLDECAHSRLILPRFSVSDVCSLIEKNYRPFPILNNLAIAPLLELFWSSAEPRH